MTLKQAYAQMCRHNRFNEWKGAMFNESSTSDEFFIVLDRFNFVFPSENIEIRSIGSYGISKQTSIRCRIKNQ